MKLNVYAIHDRQIAAFSQPYFSQTNGSALRAFSDHVNDPASPAGKYPEDYSLYRIGTYDDESGALEGAKPERIGTAAEYKKNDQQAARERRS